MKYGFSILIPLRNTVMAKGSAKQKMVWTAQGFYTCAHLGRNSPVLKKNCTGHMSHELLFQAVPSTHYFTSGCVPSATCMLPSHPRSNIECICSESCTTSVTAVESCHGRRVQRNMLAAFCLVRGLDQI